MTIMSLVYVEEVFEQLKCSREGLSKEEGERRLSLFGYNKLEDNNTNHIMLFSPLINILVSFLNYWVS